MLSEFLSDLRYRLRALFRRQQTDRDLNDELRFHLEHEAEKYVAHGVPPAEARRRARLAFGGVQRFTEETRDVGRVQWIDAAASDIRYAFRSLRRSPGFVVVAVLSLGIAIGVTGTTFAMLDAVLDPYVPYAKPDQLLTLRTYGWAAGHVDLSPEMLGTITKRSDLFVDAIPWAVNGRDQVYASNGQGMPGHIVLVGPGFVRTLGITLALGHGFAAYAAREPLASPAIISYPVWRQKFGSRRDLDRSVITVAGEQHPVVGVMPPGADYPDGTDVWLRMPQSMAAALVGPAQMQALVRLQPNVTPRRLQQVLGTYAEREAHDHGLPSHMTAVMLNDVTPRTNGIFGFNAGIAIASLLVLIVACLNIANTMLARGLARRREIAVRKAMGATGAAIVRYVMAEAVLLALAGGVLGGTLAVWGIDVVQAYMPLAMLQYWFRVPVFNWHVLVFFLAATVVTALLSGLAPAFAARRADIGEAMKDGGNAVAGRSNGGYRVVVSAQLVLSLMMAMAAATLLAGLHPPPRQVSPINEHNLYFGTVVPTHAVCRAIPHPDRFLPDLLTTIRSVPGVRQGAAAVWARPERATVTSDQPSGPVQVPLTQYALATPAYFRARGVPLVAGRDFEAGDVASGAAIVNLALAKQLWPLMSPVGRALRLGPTASDAPWVRVVGVASAPIELPDGERFDLAPPVTVVGRSTCGAANFWARVDHDDAQTLSALYHGLRAAFPGAVISDIHGSAAQAARTNYSAAVTAYTYTGVALFMLLLSAAGVFGVMSLVVGGRTREFAVRVALGAQGRDLWRLVMRDALLMGLAGIAIGAFAAMHFGPYGGLSVQWMDTDPVSLVIAEAAVVTATLLACVVPARRASRADPVEVLRAT
ncbi:MAG TPA: FtsX-like permease family protein [Gemmatimonadaceae bacterium]